MSHHRIRTLIAAVAAACVAGVAPAQPASPQGSTSGSTLDAPPVMRAGAIEYVSGGGGTEARDAMTAVQAGWSVKLVFSETSGAYLVADGLRIRGSGGDVLDIANAGPWVLVKLPPGMYAVEATYQGQTQRRMVKAGAGLQTITWRWPDAAPKRGG